MAPKVDIICPLDDDASTATHDGGVDEHRQQHLDPRIVIVGGGCFGVSTAYHLLKRGYRNVTLLDRSNVIPAPDAASNDINRIVRSSYNDKFYAALAREAIDAWRDRKFWGHTYHESGVLVLGYDNTAVNEGVNEVKIDTRDDINAAGALAYMDESYLNDIALGANLVLLPDPAAIRSTFPSNVPLGSFKRKGPNFQTRMGYLNRDGGWADAGVGIKILLSAVVQLGGKVCPGKHVSKVTYKDGKATGVLCSDGTNFDADILIIATGSWTGSAFPELGLQGKCLATGQCLAMIQLTEEEAERYQGCPVIVDFTSGFYVFPPTDKHIIKLAIHGPGYTYSSVDGISTPRTVVSHPENGLAIPKNALHQLRSGLREVYPDLAEKPFRATRLCWYNDAPDGDWIIGKCPTIENLVLATAGSGHAYKFLPVIGRLVADLIEGSLDPVLVNKFAVNRAYDRVDMSRTGELAEIDLSQLCSPEDLDTVLVPA